MTKFRSKIVKKLNKSKSLPLTLLIILATIFPASLIIFRLIENPHFESLNAAAILNDTLLWLAAVAVLGYSYLLYCQNNLQKDDLKNSKKILSQAQQQYEISQTPYIEVSIRGGFRYGGIGISFFAIRNIGNGIARNLSIETINAGGHEFRSQTIISLAPSQEWLDVFYSVPNIDTAQLNVEISNVLSDLPVINIKYEGLITKIKYEAKFQATNSADISINELLQKKITQ